MVVAVFRYEKTCNIFAVGKLDMSFYYDIIIPSIFRRWGCHGMFGCTI